MDVWDTAAVPVRAADAVGITLGLSHIYGYMCLRTAANREIRQYRREYEETDPARDEAARADPKWVAEVKLADLWSNARFEYEAAIRRTVEWSQETGVHPCVGHFSYGEWEEFIDSVRATTEAAEDGAALVSLVFCHPQSIVFHDLKHGYTYLDGRSGANWDLYFVGYSCVSPWNRMRPSKWGIPLWSFSPRGFDEIRKTIQNEHLKAVRSGGDMALDARGWQYSGNPELVSFMAYRDYPDLIDWLSLRAVKLVDANGNYLAQSLGEVVEVMSDWRQDDSEDLRVLAPGEAPLAASALPIGGALATVATALAAGIGGNAAYDLIKLAIGR